MAILEGVRLFLGGVFVLFIPGLAWSYVFFTKKNIDWIERLALSFGLSIALVPLSVFWLNWLFHMKITLLNTSLTIFGLVFFAGIIVLFRKYEWSNFITNKIKKSISTFKTK